MIQFVETSDLSKIFNSDGTIKNSRVSTNDLVFVPQQPTSFQFLGQETFGKKLLITRSHLYDLSLDSKYKLTVNGTTVGDSSGTSLGNFYAPIAAGTDGQVLKSTGSGAPSWGALTLDNISDGSSRKLSDYLPLIGGTLTGNLTIQNTSGGDAILTFQRGTPTDTAVDYRFRSNSGILFTETKADGQNWDNPLKLTSTILYTKNISPFNSNTYNIGSASLPWNVLYSKTLNLSAPSGTSPMSITSSTLVQNLNADLLDGIHAKEILGVNSGVIAGGSESSGSTDYWVKIAEYKLTTSGTLDTKATFLISSYYDTSLTGCGILCISARGGGSGTTFPFDTTKTTASWVLTNSELNNVIQVRSYCDESETIPVRYIRIFCKVRSWQRGIGIKLLNTHNWSDTNPNNWTFYKGYFPNQSADASTGTQLSITNEPFISGQLTVNTPTSGTPTILLQRGTTSDGYTDWKISGPAGNLRFEKVVSGTSTQMMNLSEGGVLTVNGQVNASVGFFQTSDINKKNILGDLDLDKAYELIDKCQTILYTLKDDESNKQEIGLIAQEVKEFFPELIATDKDGNLSLDYSRLTVVILKVLKDLIVRISKLENDKKYV